MVGATATSHWQFSLGWFSDRYARHPPHGHRPALLHRDFLPGESPRIFPTTDQEHARILQIYQQDRPYQDVANDFTEFQIGQDAPR